MTAPRRLVDTVDRKPRRSRPRSEARIGAIRVLPLAVWLASLALVALATTLATQYFATDTPARRTVGRHDGRVGLPPQSSPELHRPRRGRKTDSPPLRSSPDLQIVTGDTDATERAGPASKPADGLQMANALDLIPLADVGPAAD